jgi:hypothetical protein
MMGIWLTVKHLRPQNGEVLWSWRQIHNEELYDVYSSPNVIRTVELRRMRWEWHVARMGERKNAYGKWWERQKERDVGGRIIFKRILQNLNGMVWNGFIWLRIGTSRGSYEHGNEHTGSIKCLGIAWVIERLAFPQEVSGCMGLLMYLRGLVFLERSNRLSRENPTLKCYQLLTDKVPKADRSFPNVPASDVGCQYCAPPLFPVISLQDSFRQ